MDGSALEAVEDLTLESLAVEGGDKELWKVLGARFPQKEARDLMSEALGEVFAPPLRVRQPHSGPLEPARGWITLSCAGLTEESRRPSSRPKLKVAWSMMM